MPRIDIKRDPKGGKIDPAKPAPTTTKHTIEITKQGKVNGGVHRF